MDSEKRLIDRRGMEKQGAKKRRRNKDRRFHGHGQISELPQPTLHHILSFLSQKEAVQTCVLSKSWRYIWNARPNLEFLEKWFKENKEKFLSVLGSTLQRYHDQNLSVQQLNLEMRTTEDDPKLVSLLRKWISIALLNLGLETFRLCLYSYSPKHFDMPSAVFQAKSLQELDLTNCKLNFDDNSVDNLLTLSNLRKLYLCYVHITEKTLEHILSSCPLIDSLSLKLCELLRTINANKARNLKHFGFRAHYRNESSTVIHLPTTLESIRTEGSPNWFFHPNNNYSSQLKSLHLFRVKLSARSFNKFSSTYFPCLEKLTLESCCGFQGFQLSSPSITHLEIEIHEEIKGFKAAIDAPNILCFKFSSPFVPSISITTTSVKWESHISVTSRNGNDAFRFRDLKQLLKALSHSRIHLELHPFEYKNIEEDNDGGDSGSNEPVQIEGLRFVGVFTCSSFPDILSCLLIRTCRPNHIDMSLLFKRIICCRWGRDGTRPVESLCTILLRESEITSWKKDLEKSCIEVWNRNAGEWCRVEGTRLTEDLWLKRPDFRFRMKWRELS